MESGYYVKMDFRNETEEEKRMQFQSLESLLSEMGIGIVRKYESIGRVFVSIPDETAVFLQENGYLIEKETPGTFKALSGGSLPRLQ